MSISIKELLGYALDSEASDLHLSVGNIPMLRIHGEMKKIKTPELDLSTMKKIRDEVLNSNQLKAFKDGLEIDFSTELDGKGRFRVNFFNQINGLSAVFRTISNVIKNSDELGIPPIVNSLSMRDRGLIETAPLSFIRGRTFNNAFVIVDEAQNATIHELKTIITRVGKGSKIVLLGDTDQVDTPYIDSRTNGLTIVVEKFKASPLTGHIRFNRGQRSEVATLASSIL